MLKPERKTATRRVYRGHAVGMRVDTVETSSGKETIREVVEHSKCVAVVAIDEEDNVLLVRQFRYAVGKFLLEIPAGGIDPGEDPPDAVRRELQEEIGYLPRMNRQIGRILRHPRLRH
jgi:ADP-ribose pyrophosphatase